VYFKCFVGCFNIRILPNQMRPKLVRHFFYLLIPLLLLVGCATRSTIESRKQERLVAYTALAPEQKELVDRGQIKVGMPEEAVYIAWGAPDQMLHSETEAGAVATWVYMGQWMEETRFWSYREIARDNTTFLERYLDRDYYPRNYVSAEISFQNGKVVRWRTLPKPGY
jgi:hypothetical protein